MWWSWREVNLTTKSLNKHKYSIFNVSEALMAWEGSLGLKYVMELAGLLLGF